MARKTAVAAAAPSPEEKGKADEAARLATEKAEAEKVAAEKEAQDKAGAEALAAAEASAQAPVDEVGDWALPDVAEFPATLSITNAQPGSAHIKGTDHTLEPGETRNITFTETQFGKFLLSVRQVAELKGWKAGEGICVQEVSNDG